MFFFTLKCPEVQKTGLASIEAGGSQVGQKSIVPHETTLHAKFHVISSIGGNFTALFAGVRSLCSPPLSLVFLLFVEIFNTNLATP